MFFVCKDRGRTLFYVPQRCWDRRAPSCLGNVRSPFAFEKSNTRCSRIQAVARADRRHGSDVLWRTTRVTWRLSMRVRTGTDSIQYTVKKLGLSSQNKRGSCEDLCREQRLWTTAQQEQTLLGTHLDHPDATFMHYDIEPQTYDRWAGFPAINHSSDAVSHLLSRRASSTRHVRHLDFSSI